MTVTVHITQRAAEQVSALRRRDRASYDQFVAELRSQGCRALGYRLAGDVVDHLCVKHLRGALRVVVGFIRTTEAVVILVGPHQDNDPAIDVYAALYMLAGLSQPPAAERTKPPCCGEEDGLPPSDQKIVEDLVSRSQELAKADRRRVRRH